MTDTQGQVPGISWAELQTVLLSLADTPVKQMMVNHLVGGTRKQAAFLSPEATFREILHIGAALLETMQSPQAQLQAMETTMQRLGEGGEDSGFRAARAVLERL